MQHQIPIESIGPWGPSMAEAIQACVHCGFCLPVCPTYQVLGEEMDSPRGRIYLIKEVLEGRVPLDGATAYTDRCLGCLGCVTACPSGVRYEALITPFRAYARRRRRQSLWNRLVRRLLLLTLPYPGRFRAAAHLGRLGRPLRFLLPSQLRDMLQLLPDRIPKRQPLPEIYPAEGRRRARVALLAGCAQQVLAPDIGWATLRVLARNGVEVLVPRRQVCCGALAAHIGAMEQAQACARQNLTVFPADVDAVLTNAAGCGSGMHEYPLWLQGESEQAAARDLARRVQDVSVFLHHLGIVPPPPLEQPLTVAYHDACHLAHAQQVKSEPRAILRTIGGLELADVPDAEICCGSAGTYNLEQPAIAHELGKQKAAALQLTGARLIATGNIGCLTQIATHLRLQEHAVPVLHTLQVLDLAYDKRLPQVLTS